MRVKIPLRIKIASHTYTICQSPNLLGDESRHGEVNHRTQQITLHSANPKSVKIETLIHEVIEVGKFAYRIDISDPDIDRTAETISQFLDNLGIEFDWGNIKQEM